MTPTTQFAAEGLFRQLQPAILSLIGIIVGILVLLWIIRSFVRRTRTIGVPADGAPPVQSFLNWGAGILITVAVFGFVWHLLAVLAVNRMPRAELDRSTIYEQMDSNIKR
jgi:hypothetical protein